MSVYNSASLPELIQGCLKRNRRSQELLYKQFYSYAMALCLRYSGGREEAREILNDGYLKVFTKIDTYDNERPFKTWLGRIMINTALDYYRRDIKLQIVDQIEEKMVPVINENVTGDLTCEEIMSLVNRLSTAYRIVFCLNVIDGFSHEEIAEKLNISVGTSKSNLARAREKLKIMLSKQGSDDYARMAR